MARTSILGLSLSLQGFAPMRRAILEAFRLIDAAAVPGVVTVTGTTGILTASQFKGGKLLLLCTNASAVGISMADAENDLLPIGAQIIIHQGAGLVTMTFTGNTKTTRGVATAARIAYAYKTDTGAWTVQYPDLAA